MIIDCQQIIKNVKIFNNKGDMKNGRNVETSRQA
jgi:hypothetical protein